MNKLFLSVVAVALLAMPSMAQASSADALMDKLKIKSGGGILSSMPGGGAREAGVLPSPTFANLPDTAMGSMKAAMGDSKLGGAASKAIDKFAASENGQKVNLTVTGIRENLSSKVSTSLDSIRTSSLGKQASDLVGKAKGYKNKAEAEFVALNEKIEKFRTEALQFSMNNMKAKAEAYMNAKMNELRTAAVSRITDAVKGAGNDIGKSIMGKIGG